MSEETLWAEVDDEEIFDCYYMGYDNKMNGVPRHDNPYITPGRKLAWENGWDQRNIQELLAQKQPQDTATLSKRRRRQTWRKRR